MLVRVRIIRELVVDAVQLACVHGDGIVRVRISLLLLNDPLLSLRLVQEVSDVLSLLDLGDAGSHLFDLLFHIVRLGLGLGFSDGLSPLNHMLLCNGLLDWSRFGFGDRRPHLNCSL